MITKEEYINMESDVVPYSTEWGFVLESLKVNCPSCGEELQGSKFKFNEYPNVVTIYSAGICEKCKAFVNGSLLRIYSDGRFAWRDDNGNWVQHKDSKWVTIKKNLQRWLGL